jgi:hypothetical protein
MVINSYLSYIYIYKKYHSCPAKIELDYEITHFVSRLAGQAVRIVLCFTSLRYQ